MDSAVDADTFRSVLRHVPTPVVVVAGLDAARRPVGLTIGSFVSVSLDPPLIGFFVTSSSATWNSIHEAGSFCVNVLSASQEQLCWTFAKESPDRFAGVSWTAAPSGAPMIEDSVAWIDCSLEGTFTHGDHDLVLGRVRHLSHNKALPTPMAFLRGRVTAVDGSD